ncbi:hypothetical protein BHYA_0033g00570 [Botrytis hyacinthi]|uniref:Secreted protein CSS2 C-terminal domain-containing protein n=1 Tax=Botrytis hyacinthi TaxID=278943 RepID=A0A4Z1H662_9HELO|nr:hypothetical protein BHYA_0033g00570 [Botrytis hyacinthi]
MLIITLILLAISCMTSVYYSTTIGDVIMSGAGGCGKSYGSLDGVSWVYYATGRDYDTTAEAKTLQGAIKHHLTTTDGNSLYSTECLDLTHSGTWSGFLLIEPTNSFDSTMYCGPSLPIGACTSGRKKDI